MIANPLRRPGGDALARLHDLEWRYDGPLPPGAVAALDADAAELAGRAIAADSALVDRQARDAVGALAAARRWTAGARLDRLEGHPAHARRAACRDAGLALRAGQAGRP